MADAKGMLRGAEWARQDSTPQCAERRKPKKLRAEPASYRREDVGPGTGAVADAKGMLRGAEWARQDSNLELTGYEPAVLTN